MTIDLRLAALLFAVATPSVQANGRPESPRTGGIPAEILSGMKELSEDVAPSPDGALAAVVFLNHKNAKPWPEFTGDSFSPMSITGAPSSSSIAQIFVYRLNSREIIDVNDGVSANWCPRWSPNAQQLAFYSDRDGAARLWVWDRRSRKVTKGSDALVLDPDGCPQWFPDGRSLLTFLLPEDQQTYAQAFRMASLAPPSNLGARDEVTATSFTESTRLSASGLRADLAIINIDTKIFERIQPGIAVGRGGAALSPDGRHILLTSFQSRSADSRLELGDVILMSVSPEQEVWRLPQRAAAGQTPLWSPDGKYVAFYDSTGMSLALAVEGFDLIEFGKLQAGAPEKLAFFAWSGTLHDVILRGSSGAYYESSLSDPSLRSGPLRALTDSYPLVDSTGKLVRPLNGRGAVLRSRNSSSKLDVHLVSDLTKSPPEGASISAPFGSADQYIFVPSDRYVIVRDRKATKSPNLYLLDRVRRSARQLTDLNPVYDAFDLGPTRVVEWQDGSGQVLQGTLTLPPNFDPRRKYPMIVDVYGGPVTHLGNDGEEILENFGPGMFGYHNAQGLASRGYLVFDAGLVPIQGRKPPAFVASIMAGVDKVIDLGFVDETRLAVMGESQGGYVVRAMITQTDRFKAAISFVGLGGNLVSQYTEMAASGAAGRQDLAARIVGQNLWDNVDAFLEASPVLRYNRVKTPLFIQVGMNDSIGLTGLEAFVGLRSLGRDVELVQYAGEQHWLWGYSNNIDLIKRMNSFLARKLCVAVDATAAAIFEQDKVKPCSPFGDSGIKHGPHD